MTSFSLFAFVRPGCGAVGCGASLRRSPLRGDSPALLDLAARRGTLFAHFVRAVQTTATSQITKRAARAAASSPLLGAAEAHRSPQRRSRAVAELACSKLRSNTMGTSREAVPGRGDLCGGEKHRVGGGTRSVLRQHARRSCLSGGRTAHAASSAALPRHEHHSAVGAQRPPAQCEPLRPGAWRKPASKSPSQGRLQ